MPNESLQPTCARSCGVIGVSAYRIAGAYKQLSRVSSRRLAAELRRYVATTPEEGDEHA